MDVVYMLNTYMFFSFFVSISDKLQDLCRCAGLVVRYHLDE